MGWHIDLIRGSTCQSVLELNTELITAPDVCRGGKFAQKHLSNERMVIQRQLFNTNVFQSCVHFLDSCACFKIMTLFFRKFLKQADLYWKHAFCHFLKENKTHSSIIFKNVLCPLVVKAEKYVGKILFCESVSWRIKHF